MGPLYPQSAGRAKGSESFRAPFFLFLAPFSLFLSPFSLHLVLIPSSSGQLFAHEVPQSKEGRCAQEVISIPSSSGWFFVLTRAPATSGETSYTCSTFV